MVELNDLPDEVLEFILSQLPPYKDLEVCQLVCKRWHLLAKNVLRHAKMNLMKGLVDFRLCWKTIIPIEMNPKIAGRFSHSAVVHDNSMYIFGGGSSMDTTFNDLWRFDLSQRQWIRPLSMGSYPSPKASASMVCYADNLVLFGGFRYHSLYPPYQPWRLFDELHFYSIKNNRWTVQPSLEGPPPMAGHSASTHANKMIIFGGFQVDNEISSNSNDVWCLNLDNCTWVKPNVSNIKPAARYGQFQIALDDSNLLMIGGCGGPNNVFSDAWVLNMSGDIWQWRSVPIRNKKWAAKHMWCNPACRVGNKLVVLGPTPGLPSDVQIPKQQMPQAINRYRPNMQNEPNNVPWNRNPNPNDNNRTRRDTPNNNRLIERPIQNRNLNERSAVSPLQTTQISNLNIVNHQNGRLKSSVDDEAAIRLQRNLALRQREENLNLPKRFDEPFEVNEDRIRLAAFNVQENEPNALRERQQERVRRMEEKMHALRNSRRIAEQKPEEPSPKRAKRNFLAMYVCDISNVLASNPYLEWIEYINYGLICGAPERLILSTIATGNGELIMFGGVHKESLSEMTPQVSNSLYFLTAPRQII